jgi:hypothetical protein
MIIIAIRGNGKVFNIIFIRAIRIIQFEIKLAHARIVVRWGKGKMWITTVHFPLA